LAFLFVALIFVLSPSLRAGASNKNGNPFGNGTFFQTTGTFSAVVRGQNLSGTMMFSTGANTNGAASSGSNAATSASSGGKATISYLGDSTGSTPGIYLGNADGMWNPSSGEISGQLWGGIRLSGVNTNYIYPEIYNNTNIGTITLADGTTTNFYYYPFPIYTVSNSVTTYFGTNIFGDAYSYAYTNTVVNTIYVEPVGKNVYNDAAFISGDFSGYTQNNYPNQTFTASGTLVQQELITAAQGLDTTGTSPFTKGKVSIPVAVQGIRISDSYTSFGLVSNSVPYSTTAYTATNFSSF
jgi:hypothetical protein